MILLISFLMTLFFFSNLLTRNTLDPMELDLASGVTETGDIEYADGALQVTGGGLVRFQNLSVETNTLTIVFQPKDGYPGQRSVTGMILLRDDARTSLDTIANDYIASPAGTYNEVTVKLESKGALREVAITFESDADETLEYEVTGVILNAQESVQFSFFHFGVFSLLLTAIYLIWKLRLHAVTYDSGNKRHDRCVFFVIVLNVLIVCALGYCLRYVPEDDAYLNYYDDLMAAYEEYGIIGLGYDPPEDLLEVDNPYDFTQLKEAEVDYKFDLALYNGKYYSYFGIAPLLLYYIPYFLLTGNIAPPAMISTVMALIAVIGLGFLLMEVIRKFRIEANLLMLLLIQFALPFSVLLYTMQVSVDVYYIPLLSGLAGLIWFLFFSFRAVQERRPVRRRLLFACAAAALVIVAASRPPLVLFALVVVPLFLEVLREKTRSRAGRAIDAVVFAIPILAGAAGLMYYNLIRFDSVFEFGSTYQLTVSDIRYAKIELSAQNLINMLGLYFFYPLSINQTFPYVFITRTTILNFGNYFFRGNTVGVFGIPYYFSLFMFPFVKFRDKTERWTIILILVSALILAYAEYCIGGVLIRYVCDLLVPLALAASVITLKLAKPSGKFYYVSVGIMAATLIIGVSLIFSNERVYIMNTYADIYIMAQNLFSFY